MTGMRFIRYVMFRLSSVWIERCVLPFAHYQDAASARIASLMFLFSSSSHQRPPKIEGCATGRHSLVDPKEVFAQSPTLAAANQAAANEGTGAPSAPTTTLKSIEDYNLANPDAATAAKSVASSVKKPQDRCTVKADGSATCLNKGCQKEFQVKENNPTACWYV